ncbi:hypothetical protein [Thalassomonas haliotis]|uniref:Uncharacterized protein n=1 Tax=Thalassomonas haliotis TaxID=485448 RepID=A0ABY7VDF0_9GAMM|nr:hypothetical protein [Thalassomonas haliotis]WDE11005.1 hypothetical protein H3N35_22630 [Thalassomonas haliotis]
MKKRLIVILLVLLAFLKLEASAPTPTENGRSNFSGRYSQRAMGKYPGYFYSTVRGCG